ncbi:MAG: hypothetical protein WC878_01670 [Candidatus Paceibacterota bacterium]|jgi:hypothetical protein
MNTKIKVKANDVILLAGVSKDKLRAYLHEYPFLENYLPAVIRDLKTSRVNETLLSRNKERNTQDCLGSVYERIFLLDFAGNHVGEVGVKRFPAEKRTWKNWFPKPSYDVEIEREAVYQAVLRLEKEREAVFSEALRLKKKWNANQPHLGMIKYIMTIYEGEITVYKPPKLDEWEKRRGPDLFFPENKLLYMAEIVLFQQKENTIDKDNEYIKEVTEIRSV